MAEQRADRPLHPVPVERIGVEIAEDHRLRALGQAAGAARVIDDPARALWGEIVPIQNRISAALRRPLRSSGPSNTGGLGWLMRRWRRAPEGDVIGASQWLFEERRRRAQTASLWKGAPPAFTGRRATSCGAALRRRSLEAADRGLIDRKPREDRHSELARKHAPSIGVARPVGCAVAVEIDAARLAGVHRRAEAVGVGERRACGGQLRQRPLELRERLARRVVIELLDRQDVRPHGAKDLDDGVDLRRVLLGGLRGLGLAGARSNRRGETVQGAQAVDQLAGRAAR